MKRQHRHFPICCRHMYGLACNTVTGTACFPPSLSLFSQQLHPRWWVPIFDSHAPGQGYREPLICRRPWGSCGTCLGRHRHDVHPSAPVVAFCVAQVFSFAPLPYPVRQSLLHPPKASDGAPPITKRHYGLLVSSSTLHTIHCFSMQLIVSIFSHPRSRD